MGLRKQKSRLLVLISANSSALCVQFGQWTWKNSRCSTYCSLEVQYLTVRRGCTEARRWLQNWILRQILFFKRYFWSFFSHICELRSKLCKRGNKTTTIIYQKRILKSYILCWFQNKFIEKRRVKKSRVFPFFINCVRKFPFRNQSKIIHFFAQNSKEHSLWSF